jgi:MoaA/NifB/PqqE/SkfB family radical SAM enzyme
MRRSISASVNSSFTGGEPFILNDIYAMLTYASARVRTNVLTNAMILRGSRLDQLRAIANDNLIVQVSLDGCCAEDHDAYRGKGSWQKTVEGIELLQARGFRVRLSTTETPANSARLSDICTFHRSLGIPDEDHFVRPLAKRGYSREGIELEMTQPHPRSDRQRRWRLLAPAFDRRRHADQPQPFPARRVVHAHPPTTG